MKEPSPIRTTKNIAIATFISSLLGLTMIGGALCWQLSSTSGGSAAVVTETASRSCMLEEMARYDEGRQRTPRGGRRRGVPDRGFRAVEDGRAHARHYRELVGSLREELGSTTPAAETTALCERLRRGEDA